MPKFTNRLQQKTVGLLTHQKLSLACGLDSKLHSVDVVVGTVCRSGSHELGHISPNYPEKVLLAAQATPTPYAKHDVTGALAKSGSKEQEYSIGQNTLSGTESLTRVQQSVSTEQTAIRALCVTNTSNSGSPQLLALVEQLSKGSKSLIVRTVALSCLQEGTDQDESIEDMAVRCLEALVAELLPTGNIEAKPAEAFAEVSGSNEDTASNHDMVRPPWGTLDNMYPPASTMSDTTLHTWYG